MVVVPLAWETGVNDTLQFNVEVPQELGEIVMPEAETTEVLLDVAPTDKGVYPLNVILNPVWLAFEIATAGAAIVWALTANCGGLGL